MLSQTESWTEESETDSGSADEAEDIGGGPDFLGGGRVTYNPPRLCRLVSAASATSFRWSRAGWSESGSRCENGTGDGYGGISGTAERALQAGWVKVSRRHCGTEARQGTKWVPCKEL